MTKQQLSKIRILLTGFITAMIWSLLIWQYLHDGVPSHHLLQRADMPSMSNWWGGLLLPTLCWFFLGRIHNRILNQSENRTDKYPATIIIGFLGSLVYGGMLSLTFTNGLAEVSSVLFPAILLFALFIKVYREEYLLGFILSMSFVFGAVLPTIFATLIAMVSAIVYAVAQFIFSRSKQWLLNGKIAE